MSLFPVSLKEPVFQIMKSMILAFDVKHLAELLSIGKGQLEDVLK